MGYTDITLKRAHALRRYHVRAQLFFRLGLNSRGQPRKVSPPGQGIPKNEIARRLRERYVAQGLTTQGKPRKKQKQYYAWLQLRSQMGELRAPEILSPAERHAA